MSELIQLLLRSVRRSKGASMVEYALIIALIAIVAFVAVNNIGPPVSSAFSMANDGFTP